MILTQIHEIVKIFILLQKMHYFVTSQKLWAVMHCADCPVLFTFSDRRILIG